MNNLKYILIIYLVSISCKTPSSIKTITEKKIFNVKDFGAIGNNNTDDTYAIQNCFNEIEKNGGGIAFFPNGTYKISRTNLPGKSWCLLGVNNLTIKGENKKLTIIKLAEKQRNYTRLLTLRDNKNVNILNITFDGNLKNQINPNNPNEHLGGLFINQTLNVNISNSNFINTGGDGIGIRGANIPSTNVIIKSCYFNNNQRNGITLGSGFNDIVISNCEFGFDIDDSPIDTEPNHGNCKNVLIENNLINTPTLLTLGGAKTENPGRNFIVKNNILNNCAIFMVRADSVIIINNKINITQLKRPAITCLGSNRAVYIDNNTITTKEQTAFYLVKTRYSIKSPRDIHITNNNITVSGIKKNAFNIKGANNIYIEDNYITTKNSKTGIFCFSNYTMHSINIKNNNFNGFKTGIKIVPLKNNSIKNITISNNTFLDKINTAIDYKYNGRKELNLLENIKVTNNMFSKDIKTPIKE